MLLTSYNQKIKCQDDYNDSISSKEKAIFYFLLILILMCSFSPNNIFDLITYLLQK